MGRNSPILLEKPKSILNLNAYCLFEIFQQIKDNCELSKSKNRYKDLIYFVISNDYIRWLFLDWNEKMFAKLEIRTGCHLAGEIVFLDLVEIYKSTMPYTYTEKDKFWDIFYTCLAENAGLKCCFLKYVTTAHFYEHMETLQRIIEILKKKENLRKLSIHMPTYSAGNLDNFRNLHFLKLSSPMDADALVDCVKTNPNLKELVFNSTEVYGKLVDIAPYCKNIQFLNIEMKPDSNAKEYAALTQLPKLSHLRLGGSPETNLLGDLFKSIADYGSRTLTALTVDQPISSGIEELAKVLRIQEFVCELKEPKFDLTPIHSWQWPIICALCLNRSSTENEKRDYICIDVLSNSNHLGVTSEDMIFIRQIQLRLNNWYQRRRQDSNSNSSPMWFEINEMRSAIENLRSQNISATKEITKIAKFALLKSLENQWPTHARNIHFLAGIRDLKELRIKVKLNIERELINLVKSDIRLQMEEFEKEFPIDSETQEIIYLAILTYLRDTLVKSKFARIKSDISIQKFEMEINFDIRV